MTNFIKLGVGLLLAFAVGCTSQDVFSEELLTGWLTPSHLLVHLRFDQGTTASRLHTSFPHAIQHLAATLPLHDVELSFTSGRWRYTDWGWPLVPAKPVGAVLEASFRPGLETAALTGHWSALVNALSGLSCASLGLLRDPSSVSGGRIRLRELVGAAALNGSSAEAGAGGGGAAAVRNGQQQQQRLHALLPHEPLCTENLTPWLRLLPCRDQAGLASLLRHRPTIFGAEYVSLGLLLERRITARGRRGVRLVQTFTVVLRTAAGPQPPAQTRPSARRAAAAQPDLDPGPDLEQILSARVEHFCPAALRSEVFVAEPLARATGGGGAWGGACAAPDGDRSGRGSCPAEAAAPGVTAEAPQDGSQLLLPVNVRAGAPPGPAADLAVSRALPRLRRYDVLELLEVSGRALGLRLPSPSPSRQPGASVADQPRAVGSAAVAGGGADLLVDRYVTGAGLLRGGMVLRIQRSAELRARLAASLGGAAAEGCVHVGNDEGGGGECGSGVVGDGGGDGGSGGDGGAVCALSVVCVHQQFPWYVRPWLHTLAVLYDGQEVRPLRSQVVAQHVRPAMARASPGVLDLCLRVPPAVAEVQLQLAFSKAFLTVFEYPPDAHRGFDVPAAVISYADPLYAPAVQWRTAATTDGGGGDGGGGGGEGDGGGEALTSPLLAALARGPAQQVYTPGLLVPLAAPDFSMPYNVICLSSTVFAVYFGALLNLLTRRGRSAAAIAAADAAAAAGGRSARASAAGKAAQAVLMMVLFGALALYLDAELRAQAEALLAGWGLELPLGSKPPGCGAQRC